MMLPVLPCRSHVFKLEGSYTAGKPCRMERALEAAKISSNENIKGGVACLSSGGLLPDEDEKQS